MLEYYRTERTSVVFPIDDDDCDLSIEDCSDDEHNIDISDGDLSVADSDEYYEEKKNPVNEQTNTNNTSLDISYDDADLSEDEPSSDDSVCDSPKLSDPFSNKIDYLESDSKWRSGTLTRQSLFGCYSDTSDDEDLEMEPESETETDLESSHGGYIQNSQFYFDGADGIVNYLETIEEGECESGSEAGSSVMQIKHESEVDQLQSYQNDTEAHDSFDIMMACDIPTKFCRNFDDVDPEILQLTTSTDSNHELNLNVRKIQMWNKISTFVSSIRENNFEFYSILFSFVLLLFIIVAAIMVARS